MKHFIADKLSHDFPGQKWAFVHFGNDVYFSVFQESEVSYAMSPVICLLQQIFETKKDHSFFILRKAIVTNYTPAANEKGMVKVVAKRIQQFQAEDPNESNERTSLAWVRHMPRPLASLSEFHRQSIDLLSLDPWAALQRLVDLIPRGAVLHDYDRPIAAILVDSTGQVLDFGVNSNHINKTLHAEVNLLQRYYQKHGHQLPSGSRIYVTHKPCKMCAGMIWEALPEDFVKPAVIYFEDVPGRLSVQTKLDEEGCLLKGISARSLEDAEN